MQIFIYNSKNNFIREVKQEEILKYMPLISSIIKIYYFATSTFVNEDISLCNKLCKKACFEENKVFKSSTKEELDDFINSKKSSSYLYLFDCTNDEFQFTEQTLPGFDKTQDERKNESPEINKPEKNDDISGLT